MVSKNINGMLVNKLFIEKDYRSIIQELSPLVTDGDITEELSYKLLIAFFVIDDWEGIEMVIDAVKRKFGTFNLELLSQITDGHVKLSDISKLVSGMEKS
jgi:hypothetical protein